MKKDMIVLIARIFISLAGLACLAVCIAQNGDNQILLWIGFVLNTIAFLLYFCISKKNK